MSAETTETEVHEEEVKLPVVTVGDPNASDARGFHGREKDGTYRLILDGAESAYSVRYVGGVRADRTDRWALFEEGNEEPIGVAISRAKLLEAAPEMIVAHRAASH